MICTFSKTPRRWGLLLLAFSVGIVACGGASVTGRAPPPASSTAATVAPSTAASKPAPERGSVLSAAEIWAEAVSAALATRRMRHPEDAARLPSDWGAEAPRFAHAQGALDRLAGVTALCDGVVDEGLVPAALGCDALAAARAAMASGPSPATGADVEIAAHAVVLRYADALGALEPPPSKRKVIHRPRNLPAPPGEAADAGIEGERRLRIARLLARLGTETVEAVVATLQPAGDQYGRLKVAAARYRGWADGGGFGPSRPEWNGLRRGTRSPAVSSLRARLAAEGFASAPAAGDDAHYEATLDAAIARYRLAHLLEGRSSVERNLLRTLDKTAADKHRTLVSALRAWRAAPRRSGRYVQVNIPDFHLEYWRDGGRIWRTRVVVGSAIYDEDNIQPNATPTLASKIHTIVFKPFWNVPERITEEEILKGETFWNDDDRAARLAEKGYELVDPNTPKARVRQLPGRGNALGLVKFQFRNTHAVYLHDTPAKRVFGKARRALSHGCVRVQHPLELARMLLRDDGQYNARNERKWLADEEPTEVGLEDAVPVFLDYILARVDDDGSAVFLPDIYDTLHPRKPRRSASRARARKGL